MSTKWPPRAKEQTPEITGRPDEPWWTREAITWMDEHLEPHMNVLEWGSGASTAWLARRAGYVTTMEHDEKWHQRTVQALWKLKLADRWQAVRFPLGETYCLTAIDYARRHGRIDVAIVDGRLRVRCCELAMHALASGGILLLDNAERKKYAPARALLSSWPVVETANGIWHTNIWIKPS